MSITADHILDALVSTSADKIWATEVPFRGSTTRIDFWTLEPTASAGFRATSYEIKVSRQDFKRDSEEKQAGALRHSDRFIYVTPPGLLTKVDVPSWAGLLEWDGATWRVVKRPPRLEKAAEPGWGLLVDILRNSGQCRRDIAILTLRIQMAERQARQNCGYHAYGYSPLSRLNQRFAYRPMKDDRTLPASKPKVRLMSDDDILLRRMEALGAEVAKANAERDKALAKVSFAQSYGWRHALYAAATTAHGLIAMDYVADNVRDRILSLINTNPWRPIAEADKDIAYIHDLGELRIGNSYPIWARDEDGRVFEALWSDDGKRSYWWDIEGESPVDPVEFMPHPLDPRFAPATEARGVND